MKRNEIARISLVERDFDAGFEISGLAIFDANSHFDSSNVDPRLRFLDYLSSQVKMSCLLGYTTIHYDLGEDIGDVLGAEIASVAQSVPIDLLLGKFSQTLPGTMGGYLIPDASLLFKFDDEDKLKSLKYIIRRGAIAMFASTDNEFVKLENMANVNEHLLIFSGHDGITFEGPQSGLSAPIVSALVDCVEELRDYQWFQDNIALFQWDELEQCLVIRRSS